MQSALYGIIYIARSPSGRAYVGQTINSFAERRRQHYADSGRCRLLHRAIKKHGDKMRWEVIASAWDKEGLDYAERELIRQHRTLAPVGYNLKEGGAHGRHGEEARAKVSAANSGRKRSAKTIAKMSAAQVRRFADPDERKKLIAGLTGRKPSPAAIANMKAAQKGRPRTPAQLAALRAANEERRLAAAGSRL